MATPLPFSLAASSFVFTLVNTALQKVASQGSRMLGRLRVVMGTATGLALSYSVYRALAQGDSLFKRAECKKKRLKKLRAPKNLVVEEEMKPRDGLMPRPEDAVYLDLAASAMCQPSLTAQEKAHALFLWIRVKKEADPQEVACRVARLQQYVQEVEAPMESCCEDFKILAGVGFGPEFYQQIKGGAPQSFTNAKHSLISSSSVGGDIFVHAKANDQDLLKQFGKTVLANLPKDSVLCHEETFAQARFPEEFSKPESSEDEPSILNYQYTKGDTEPFPPDHPQAEDKPWLLFVSDTGSEDSEGKQQEVAMDNRTGGSYVMTQRWVHDLHLFSSNGDILLDDWVDRAWEECAGPPGERKFKSPSMLRAELADVSMDQWLTQAYKECVAMQKKHPDRQIICTPGFTTTKRPFRILRQSLPYKNKGGESGLFFISYASTPKYNELLLDRLVSSACGEGKLNSVSQNVFRLSRNVRSSCWYFPGLQELRELE